MYLSTLAKTRTYCGRRACGRGVGDVGDSIIDPLVNGFYQYVVNPINAADAVLTGDTQITYNASTGLPEIPTAAVNNPPPAPQSMDAGTGGWWTPQVMQAVTQGQQQQQNLDLTTPSGASSGGSTSPSSDNNTKLQLSLAVVVLGGLAIYLLVRNEK